MEDIIENVVKRYLTDAEFKNKIDKVVRVLEADKQTALDEEEMACVIFAAGVTLLLQEVNWEV